MRKNIITLCLCILSLSAVTAAIAAVPAAEAPKKDAIAWIAEHHTEFEDAALAVHTFAETGLEEYRSAEYLSNLLEKHGFTVERGVAGMPTAFVAVYGSGSPIVGILAEYDALPGLSQKPSVPVHDPVEEGAPGHGCGHNLFGAGSVAAAIGMKTVMEKYNIPGTVKLFGSPAEETIIGKVFMARAGVFDGLDACLNWHPGGGNGVHVGSNNALNSFEIAFHGKTAHAAANPQAGRSALDAVELMDAGVNFMREHLWESVRIHYVITDGGMAPNVVPENARVWYFIRDVSRKGVEDVYARVLKCAEGAALMTDTTYEVKFISGTHNYLSNVELSRIVYDNLVLVGPPSFTDNDQKYAKELQATLGAKQNGLKTDIGKFKPTTTPSRASTDASEVSWIAPTSGEMGTACIVPGSPGHSWAVTSAAGSASGLKGMITAGQVLAASGIDVLLDADARARIMEEFKKSTGGKPYKSPLPDGLEPSLPEKK